MPVYISLLHVILTVDVLYDVDVESCVNGRVRTMHTSYSTRKLLVGFCLWLMLSLGRYNRYSFRRKRFMWPYFELPDEHRLRHIHIIGTTGTGKSTLIAHSAIQDIRAGKGIALFDIHGDLAGDVLACIPRNRRRDTIYFKPHDRQFPIGFNVLESVPDESRSLVASGVLDAFHHLFKDSWGPQLEQILHNAALAMLSIPGSSLLTMKYFLTHKDYRESVLKHVSDPVIKDFWEHDFAKHMSGKEQKDRTLSTLNKIGHFLGDPLLRNIVSQPTSAFTFPAIFDNNSIFIADLSNIGTKKAALLGSLLIAKLHAAALSREIRHPFFVYVDEFQNFGSSSFIAMLSEIRKFGVSLTLAHQYMGQLPTDMQSAILGTVGTHASFTIGPYDADLMAPHFSLKLDDLMSLPPYSVYVRTDRTIELTTELPPFRSYRLAQTRIRNRCRKDLAVPMERQDAAVSAFVSQMTSNGASSHQRS